MMVKSQHNGKIAPCGQAALKDAAASKKITGSFGPRSKSMGTIIIAVVVAFLVNGEVNYASVDARDEADCRAKVAQIAHDRVDQNATESVKIDHFEFKCVGFGDAPAPKHIPGKDEA